MPDPGVTRRISAPRRDPAVAAGAALQALVDATPFPPELDPARIHRALVRVILRLVILHTLGELPPAPRWPDLLARSHAFYAEHASPLFAPDPDLAALNIPDAALTRTLATLAHTTPGDLHQSLLSLRLERAPDHRLHLRPGSERRHRGGHYTDDSLARTLIHATLRPLLADLGPHPTPAQLLDLQVCDPAMGCAAFLIAACDILADHLARARNSHDLTTARRDVALTCLHGVDLDPLAVELARLSLWRHLGDRHLPLATLENKLRHGDALVGLHLPQIPHSPPSSPADLTLAADALIAAHFSSTRPGEREQTRQRLLAQTLALPAPTARQELSTFLATFLAASQPRPIHPFHWPLEFPAIFTRPNPGFDLVIGNPPFFWGNRIGRAFGPEYRDWLQTLHPGAHGNSDLAAHFLRRGFALLRDRGGLGFVTTNSISEAETRATGLAYILSHGGTLHHAVRDMPWPGSASVRVATICVRRGPVPGPHTLDGHKVPTIASDLRPTSSTPRRLPARRDQSFKGVDFGGTGFLLTPAARDELLRLAPAEADFVWPVLNASQLVTRATHEPTHHIINLGGHELAELTTRAPHCLDILRRTVLPRRQLDRRRHRRERWWLYNEACPGLYQRIRQLPRVLVGPVVARHIVFDFADPHTVFTNALNVFAFSDPAALALLQARPHESWALRHASSLRCDPRYNPTTCFETYPFPPNWQDLHDLRALGEIYHQHRGALMQRHGHGLTTTYNRFHDPRDTAADIVELRRLHAELDHAVLRAHAWHDLLPHAIADFHPDPPDAPPRTRLRWPTALADEVHARLLAANHAT